MPTVEWNLVGGILVRFCVSGIILLGCGKKV